MGVLRVIVGDQLSLGISALAGLQPERDVAGGSLVAFLILFPDYALSSALLW